MKPETNLPPARRPKASPSRGRRNARRGKTSNPVIELVPSFLKLKSILVPVDFSQESEKALAYAVSFARQFGSRITLLHVVEMRAAPEFARSFPLAIEEGKLLAEARSELERLARRAAPGPGLIERLAIRGGHPFREITDAARGFKADLIVISTRGRTGLKHVLLGSTAERVVRHAPCPVLVVRTREKDFIARRKLPSM